MWYDDMNREELVREVQRLREALEDRRAGSVRGGHLGVDGKRLPGTVDRVREATTERTIEEELRRSEHRFRTIFNHTDISIWEEDFSQVKGAIEALRAQGVEDFRGYIQEHPGFVEEVVRTIRVVDVNQAALVLYGAGTKEQLLGHLDRVLLPETRPMLQEFVLAIADGRSRFDCETVNRALDGRILNIHVRLILPEEEAEYRSLLLCIIDITAQKQLEAERRRTQKLESLGVLAGGIAHDFNNLLMGITGGISLARMHIETCGSESAVGPLASLQGAEQACERARSLTHQLLTFARGGAPVKKALAVKELLRSAVNFGLSGSNVRCEFEVSDEVWNIEADEHQFTQVISHIVLNGAEAMPDGGVLKVHARNRRLAEREVSNLQAGKVVEIRIEDHGIGIPEEHIHRVFDPYFTAKKGGRGLGLAIVHSVVLKHGGHVRLDSEIGMGTQVTLFLPATDVPPQRTVGVPEPTGSSSGAILVMDDEEIVRAAAAAMLEYLGYTAETTGDGAEMLAHYKAAWARRAPFDAVIMDLTIPGGMGGVEGLKELLAFHPEAKAIVSSGYSNDPVMANHQAYGFAGVVPKPYRIEDLHRALQGVLAKTLD